jgi:hypothetical protein
MVPGVNQAPCTFLDKRRLDTGTNLGQGFGRALCQARIAVVVVSTGALKRMSGSGVDLEKDVSAA